MLPDQIRRVTYSKYLLRKANAVDSQSDELTLALSVLAAHDAVEILMRVVADFMGATLSNDFMAFWEAVSTKSSIVPSHKDTIKSLNKLRISFKHYGLLPNTTVVKDLLPVVTAFCIEIARNYLNIDFDTVTLADLIQNDEARLKIKSAEKSFVDGDRQTTFFELGQAYEVLLKEAQVKFGFAIEKNARTTFRTSSSVSAEVRQVLSQLDIEQMKYALQRTIDATNMLALGVSPQKLKRFKELVPTVQYSVSGKFTVSWLKRPSEEKEDLDFCVSFLIDFALRL